MELQPSKRYYCYSPQEELHLNRLVSWNSVKKASVARTIWNEREGLFFVGRLGHWGCRAPTEWEITRELMKGGRLLVTRRLVRNGSTALGRRGRWLDTESGTVAGD